MSLLSNCEKCSIIFEQSREPFYSLCKKCIEIEMTKIALGNQPKGGVKNDSAKPDLTLIPREPLWELARVLMAGEKKYGRWNWQEGIDIHRLTAASLRHITQFNDGEDIDEETQTSHLLNASANLFFAYWMLKNKPKHDTRPKK